MDAQQPSTSLHSDGDQCTLCGRHLTSQASEEWSLPTGEKIFVAKPDQVSACIDTPQGEISICEGCYENVDFSEPDQDMLAEIHYQFGVEYREHGQHSKSMDALHQALRLKRNPDFLSAMAYGYDKMGEPALAHELYLQALRLDPNHFMSRHNLKLLEL